MVNDQSSSANYDWNDPANLSITWFINHAEAGRTEQCMMALDRGLSVDGKSSSGRTALGSAIMCRRIETAFALLDRGADIKLKQDSEESVLHKVYAWGSRDILLLIERGADVNAKDVNNSTPLHCITDIDAVRVLLEHGADPNVADENGQTPIMNAALSGYKELCIMLASFGADINAGNFRQNGRTALIRAMSKNDTRMGALLVALGAKPFSKHSGRNAEWRKITDMPRLHAAAFCGETQLAISLASCPSDLEHQYRRKTASQIATESLFHDTAAALQSLRARMAINDMMPAKAPSSQAA
jgi:ankyrin repeat protein